MMKVKQVEALPRHQLRVSFSDGSSGVADLSDLVIRAPFLAIQDEAAFSNLVVDQGAVEWPDGDVGIATEMLYALAHGLPKATTLEQVDANELTVSLRELRNMLGATQAEVARESDLTQSSVALFEAAKDHKLSALRRYLTALGCELEITAVKDGRRFPLHGL